jgi:arylformamidase
MGMTMATPVIAFGSLQQPWELVFAYGTHELPELCRQSIDYARTWTERGLPGDLLPIEGANHFTILEALADPQGVLARALLNMSGA